MVSINCPGCGIPPDKRVYAGEGWKKGMELPPNITIHIEDGTMRRFVQRSKNVWAERIYLEEIQ